MFPASEPKECRPGKDLLDHQVHFSQHHTTQFLEAWLMFGLSVSTGNRWSLSYRPQNFSMPAYSQRELQILHGTQWQDHQFKCLKIPAEFKNSSVASAKHQTYLISDFMERCHPQSYSAIYSPHGFTQRCQARQGTQHDSFTAKLLWTANVSFKEVASLQTCPETCNINSAAAVCSQWNWYLRRNM